MLRVVSWVVDGGRRMGDDWTESVGEVGERYSNGGEAFSCGFDGGVVGGSSGGGVSIEV